VQQFDIPSSAGNNSGMKSTVDEFNFLREVEAARSQLKEEKKAAEEANKKQQEAAAKPDAKREFLEKMIAEAPTSELKFMLQNQLAMHNLTHHQQQTKLTKSSSAIAAIHQKEKQLDDEMSEVAKSVINKADDRNAKLQKVESLKKQFQQELGAITEQERLLNKRRGQLEVLLSQLTQKEAKLQASLSTVNEAKKLVVKDIFNTADMAAFGKGKQG
jgi:DNA repair exonuclease SbcCD ATPase subunit